MARKIIQVVLLCAFTCVGLPDSRGQQSGAELPKDPWSGLAEVTSYNLVTCPDGKGGFLITFKQTSLPLRYHSARFCPKDGPKDGRINHWSFASYDNAGRQVDEGEFLEGKMYGKCISWHSNGVKQAEGNYSNGEPVGSFTSWHDNGEIAVTGNYLNGKPDGIWAHRDLTGRVTEIFHWHNGKVVSREKFD